MSVLVPMKMPEMCLVCQFYQDAWNECKLNVKIEHALEKPKDCPLIEVIDPLKEYVDRKTEIMGWTQRENT